MLPLVPETPLIASKNGLGPQPSRHSCWFLSSVPSTPERLFSREPAASVPHLFHPVLSDAGIYTNHWQAEPPSRTSAWPRYITEPTPIICPQNSAPGAPLTSRGSKMAERERRGPAAWPTGISASAPPPDKASSAIAQKPQKLFSDRNEPHSRRLLQFFP